MNKNSFIRILMFSSFWVFLSGFIFTYRSGMYLTSPGMFIKIVPSNSGGSIGRWLGTKLSSSLGEFANAEGFLPKSSVVFTSEIFWILSVLFTVAVVLIWSVTCIVYTKHAQSKL